MPKAVTDVEPTSDYATNLDRARKGDKIAFEALKEGLPVGSDLWQRAGDLSLKAEKTIITTAFGVDDLVVLEGVRRQLDALKRDLNGSSPTPIERVLVDRIGVCWLALNLAEIIYHQAKGLSPNLDDSHQRRIDRCHHRYLSAIRALAVVRRLQRPVVQVNCAENQINVAR